MEGGAPRGMNGGGPRTGAPGGRMTRSLGAVMVANGYQQRGCAVFLMPMQSAVSYHGNE
jgi:hypothetical protein